MLVSESVKDPKIGTPKMILITALRKLGIIGGFLFLDPLGGLGSKVGRHALHRMKSCCICVRFQSKGHGV